jgi:hypothetical protein
MRAAELVGWESARAFSPRLGDAVMAINQVVAAHLRMPAPMAITLGILPVTGFGRHEDQCVGLTRCDRWILEHSLMIT